MPRSLLIICLLTLPGSVAAAADQQSRPPRDSSSARDTVRSNQRGEARSGNGRVAPRPAGTGGLVEIITTDGHTLVGHVEPQSTMRTVYLRSEEPGIIIRSIVPRSSIQHIGHHDRSRILKLDGAKAPATSEAASRGGRVQSLRVQAWPENRDRDADLDGVRLLVTPLSATGRPVVTHGNLTVRLIARRFNGQREHDTVDVVEEWSHRLTAQNFGPDGAIVDLPFRRLNPERDLEVIPVGLLQAELSVAGEGVFAAPTVEFWLRPPSYIRDELQLHTGSREFRPYNRPRTIPGR